MRIQKAAFFFCLPIFCLQSMPLSMAASSAPVIPHFTGRLVFSPDIDGRHMTLLENFGFVDSDKSDWPVPKGAVTDGSSIPSLFWGPIFGGPFEGKHRRAAVIHDYYCDVRIRTWESVDRMFYDAMLADGEDPMRAKAMYAAVRKWGPHWDGQTIINSRLRAAVKSTDISLDAPTTAIRLSTSEGTDILMPWIIAGEAADSYKLPATRPIPSGRVLSFHKYDPKIFKFATASVASTNRVVYLPDRGQPTALLPQSQMAPVPTNAELNALIQRVDSENPSLDQIDQW